jgi:sugar lactone lactonase YvrE
VIGTGTIGSSTNQLYYPFGLAVDSANALYIADYGNNRILKVPSGASTGTVVAGQSSGASGSGLNYLYYPTGVVVDSAFTVYVADLLNYRGVSWTNGASTGTLIAGTTGMKSTKPTIF